MKRSTVVWRMKNAIREHGVSPEFWKEVKELLRTFEQDLKARYKK